MEESKNSEPESNQAKAINKSRLKRVLLFLLRSALAIGIVWFLIVKNKGDLVKAFQKVKVEWMVFAFFLYLIQLLFGAVRWQILLKIQNIRLSFYEVVSFVMQGFFFSLVIPGGAVGGDLVKIGLIASRAPKGSRLEGSFSILIDRIIGMIALFSIVLFAVLFNIEHIKSVSGLLKGMVWSIIAACLLGLFATGCIYFHRQLEKIKLILRLMNFCDRLSNGAVTRLNKAMDLYRSAWKILLFCIILSILGVHLNLVVINMLIIKGMGGTIISITSIMFSVTFALVAGLIPLTPSGLGFREWMMLSLLHHTGYGKGIAAAVPFIFTTFIMFFNLTGGIFFLFQPKTEQSSQDPIRKTNDSMSVK